MWLEREQNLNRRIPEESNQFANQVQALPSINPVSYSLPQVTSVSQPAFTKDDVQKAIQDALAQQKTENQALVKKVTELQSQMTQQAQAPALQTVEPVRQLKGPPAFTKSEEGMRNYHISEYLKNLGFLSKEEIDRDYPVKPFQRSRPQQNDNSSRIDRMEEGLNETRESVNLLTEEFQKLNILPPDSNSEENDGNDYDKDNNMWTGYDPPVKKQVPVNEPLPLALLAKSSQPETYDELLPKLSPAMWKMYLSQKAQEEQSKKDEWFSSLQYLNASINDLSISESFLDNASEFDGFNLAIAEALGWKVDKPSKFLVKDNGESKPMLWLGATGIRKVKGISDPTNNRFHIENHGKTYTIPTFSKAPVVKDPPKEDQDQVSTDSFSPTSEDFKKNA
ncbi:hypothetical protein GLOIN_2v1763195 [Rhizophagus clarus]|nr:hypothetical protein GLOIN_2v1763195 [Rhizophagus clarus]